LDLILKFCEICVGMFSVILYRNKISCNSGRRKQETSW